MGETVKKFIVKKSSDSKEGRQIEFLIDSGATYSLVPGEVLSALGVTPHKTVEVVLADGSRLIREVGDAFFEYHGEGGATPVIFGEKGEEPLLGVLTLEALGLVLNPFRREIYPGRTIRL